MKINKGLSEMYKVPVEKYMQRSITDELYIQQYDAMTANPLLSYFTQADIAFLNKLAMSPSMHNNVKEKYRQMDTLMAERGFKVIGGGTNRRAYECLYDFRVVAKVSTDSIGFTSNLKEYINQNVLKPFCCKIFEVSQCGTLAIIEKVQPVKEVRDLDMFVEDVHKLLFFKIRNKNIAMEDIGLRSLKNWGYRPNFGPVLLDYPTMYVADPKKRLCNRIVNGCLCNGSIDYDEGYDYIRCTSCGCTILSKTIAKEHGDHINELTFAVSNNKNILNGGTSKMKFILEEINEDGTREIVTEKNIGGMSKFVDPRATIVPRKENSKAKENNKPNFSIDIVEEEQLIKDLIDCQTDTEKSKDTNTTISEEQNKSVYNPNREFINFIDSGYDNVNRIFDDLVDIVDEIFRKNNDLSEYETVSIMDNKFLKTLHSIYMHTCNSYEREYIDYLTSFTDDHHNNILNSFITMNCRNIYFRLITMDCSEVLRTISNLLILVTKIRDSFGYTGPSISVADDIINSSMNRFFNEYTITGKITNLNNWLKDSLINFESKYEYLLEYADEDNIEEEEVTSVEVIDSNDVEENSELDKRNYFDSNETIPITLHPNDQKQANRDKYEKRKNGKKKNKYKN